MYINIFSALSKYNSAKNENYLTEAFVFILNHLLQNDRPLCLPILEILCVNNDEYSFGIDEEISITTQETTEFGRPDIQILTPDKLIYIEVKHDSGLGDKQLDNYNQALIKYGLNKTITRLIFLSRFPSDLPESSEKPNKHVHWYEIYNILSKYQTKDQVIKFLIQSFMEFLEVKKMSVQKVTWEYIKGVTAFKDLINMLGVAIEAAGLTIYQKTAGWEWMGYYIEDNNNFLGVYYDTPLFISFGTTINGKWKTVHTLDFEQIHFFSLNKDEQFEKITNFIKVCFKK